MLKLHLPGIVHMLHLSIVVLTMIQVSYLRTGIAISDVYYISVFPNG